MSLCDKSSNSYIPVKAVVNSCMNAARATGMISGKSYVTIATITWEFYSFPDKFSFWLQGSQHHKTNGWGWTTSAYPTDALMTAMGSTDCRLTSIAKSNPKYSKRVAAQFTCPENYDGFEIGCRCNYADGNSWVKMEDVLIIPSEYYVGQLTGSSEKKSIKINKDEIIADNFIEC